MPLCLQHFRGFRGHERMFSQKPIVYVLLAFLDMAVSAFVSLAEVQLLCFSRTKSSAGMQSFVPGEN